MCGITSLLRIVAEPSSYSSTVSTCTTGNATTGVVTNPSAVPATFVDQPMFVPASNGVRLQNCTEAIAMSLTDVQAAQWPHLDRASDGE